MKSRIMLVGLAALYLGSCQAEPDTPRQTVERLENGEAETPENQFGFWQAQEQGISLPDGYSGADAARDAAMRAERGAQQERADDDVPFDDVPPAGSQIAYNYSWGFRVGAKNLPVLQERHRDLCVSMGDDCRILSLAQSGDGDYAYGRVRMQVAADQAETFGNTLTAAGQDVAAEQVSFAISGEDLTTQIIDTQAHLEARQLLRDRLMEVLRTREGSVADLVAAERGVAEVNEEIDAAQSRLASMRGRVLYTDVNIEYGPQLGSYGSGFWSPIATAFASIGSTLGFVIALLIYALTALGPIALLVLALRWLWRRYRSWRGLEKEPSDTPYAAET